MLCRRADVSSDICGPKHQQQGLCVHECCLVSSGPRPRGLCWRCGAGRGGPVRVTDGRGLCSLQCCFACGERGASISCQEKGCSRSFHLPCASEHGCVTQFFRQFRSFCWEHRPEQTVQARPDAETTCIICLEPVGDKISHNTMVCPACKGTWFHRGCIRVGVHAGRSCFRCPQCNNKRKFLPEMLRMGILVPIRTPAWEEDGGYEELYQRHSRCDASQCLSRQGREQAEERGPWELLLCSSCASKGTHRRCSALGTASDTWECDGCAGLGPGKWQSAQVPTGLGQGPGKAWQWVLWDGLAEHLCPQEGWRHCSSLSGCRGLGPCC
uniref:PHD finger protein 7 n=1 Tax=Apteryx owenii TaxID=8824 RepID=A0A8B9S4T4_APTOW